MILDAVMPQTAVQQLAALHEPEHEVLRDLLLKIHRPDLIAMDDLATTRSPLETFASALKMLANHRKTILVQAAEARQISRVDFSLFGVEVSIGQNQPATIAEVKFPTPLNMRTTISSVGHTALADRFIIHGLLHQVLAEIAGMAVGHSCYMVEEFQFSNTAVPGDAIRPYDNIRFPMPMLAQHVDKEEGFKLLGEDLEIMTCNRAAVGYRNRWVRRVASPMWQARVAMAERHDKEHALTALQFLRQCHDIALRDSASEWLRRTFTISKESTP